MPKLPDKVPAIAQLKLSAALSRRPQEKQDAYRKRILAHLRRGLK